MLDGLYPPYFNTLFVVVRFVRAVSNWGSRRDGEHYLVRP